MGKKKNKGGGMSQIRKWGKRILSGFRIAVVVVTAGHGAIWTAGEVIQGRNPIEQAPRLLVYKYTGYNSEDGSFDRSVATASVLTIGGGLVAAWLIGQGIKHV